MSTEVSKAALFTELPPPWREDLQSLIRQRVAALTDHKLVVLDDDPTGTQTVYDIPVLTVWDTNTLASEFENRLSCFYILTNARGLSPARARELNLEIARNLKQAASRCGCRYTVISRSDSTLRGHYPVETTALGEVLGPFHATILFPYFEAGGRYTIHDLHYVAEGDVLRPVATTPFARDPVFAYRSSNLRDFVEEKTRGVVKFTDVHSIDLRSLRLQHNGRDPARVVADQLVALPEGATVIVNGCHPSDAFCFALATLMAEEAGRRFLYRTAAQFVAARLGLEERRFAWLFHRTQPPPLLNQPSRPGGLILVGSHVLRTTEQLEALEQDQLPRNSVTRLNVPELLKSGTRESAIQSAAKAVQSTYRTGSDAILATSRELVLGSDDAENFAISASVSSALVEIVKRFEIAPRFIIAKGGITSSDVATEGLGVRRAMVLGQLLPGVPVWRLGKESKFPGLPYVAFPGNVGSREALVEAVRLLREE